MNGEMYQICSIVSAAKKAIQSGEPIQYTPAAYENSTAFSFRPEKKLFRVKTCTAPDVPSWFNHIRNEGLQDIMLLCPISVKDKHLLGFSNTTGAGMVCFFKGCLVTCFTADWQFDSQEKRWNVLYSEWEWRDPPREKPRFQSNLEPFKKTLQDIRDLAVEIECEYFADIFESARRLLTGEDKNYSLQLPIPRENLPLLEAACRADVFGAMGSWNDSPPYMAHEKGLDGEYERLSEELLRNIRLAVLYAVNEW